MDVAKPYNLIRFCAMDVTKPCNFMRCGAMYVTKSYKMYMLCWHVCHHAL